MQPDAYLDMAAKEADHWWFAGRRLVLRACIARLKLGAGARILELGSGTGGNLDLLKRFGAVMAVEMNAAARAISLARHQGADVRPGTLPHDLGLGGQLFDLVCLFDVLEHVEDDDAALRTARAHLAPGGALLLTVPAYKALFGPHDEQLHHKRRYESAELAAKLRDAGFRVEKLSHINAALLPAALAARLLDKRLRRPNPVGAKTPPGPVNALLARIFGAEAWILPHVNIPFGLSLLALARPEN